MAVNTKHFNLPFRFEGTNDSHAVEVEQDTLSDVVNCVYVAYLVEPGYRIEIPTFGVPHQIFALEPLDLQQMINAVMLWEPRAEVLMTQVIDPSDQTLLVSKLKAIVAGRESTGG